MDDKLQKRNTDCVFFMASPLTCKKGIECEFRHNDMARLNPTDCRYWLSGNCLYPSCHFRHPPLDMLNASGSDPSQPKNQTGVPCYFYNKGFCSKGHHCAYLHANKFGVFGPSASAAKSLKKGSQVERLSRDTVSTDPTEGQLSSSKPTLKAEAIVASQTKEDLEKLPLNSVVKLSDSSKVSASKTEESIVGATPLEEPSNCNNHASMDQSFGFGVKLCDDDDFAVLDNEHKLSKDGESIYLQELNSPVLYRDLEEPDEYDPMHPDAGILGKYRATYDSWSDLDDVEKVQHLSDERLSVSADYYSAGLQLRDGQRRHRRIGEHSSFHLSGFSQERLEGKPRRFKKSCESIREKDRFLKTQTRITRDQIKRRRHLRSSATTASRKSFPRISRHAMEDSSFAGPKSLDQIREEKSGKFSRKKSFADFPGPKPLMELLKNKLR